MDKEKQTQVGKIFEYLKANTSITRKEAVKLGIYDLPKTIHNLKKTLTSEYFIQTEKNKQGFATYTLVKKVEVKQEAKQETEQAKTNGSYLLLKTLMEIKSQLSELNENISELSDRIQERNGY